MRMVLYYDHLSSGTLIKFRRTMSDERWSKKDFYCGQVKHRNRDEREMFGDQIDYRLSNSKVQFPVSFPPTTDAL